MDRSQLLAHVRYVVGSEGTGAVCIGVVAVCALERPGDATGAVVIVGSGAQRLTDHRLQPLHLSRRGEDIHREPERTASINGQLLVSVTTHPGDRSRTVVRPAARFRG